MQRFLITMLFVSFLAPARGDDVVSTFVPGDGTVDGKLLGEYHATWRQCMVQEGQWTNAGEVTETATIIGPLLRHRQVTSRPDGIVSNSTTYMDHATLAPQFLEQVVTAADGTLMGRSQRTIKADGYLGWSQRGGEPQKSVQGTLNSKSFNGALLGVPLSTLNFSATTYRFDAFMMMFDAHYEVIASLAGDMSLEHDGQSLAVRLVDVEWHHDNGDIYPPGPDASGGRFWILAEDHPALPRVLRYKTDTYTVEALPQVCPGG